MEDLGASGGITSSSQQLEEAHEIDSSVRADFREALEAIKGEITELKRTIGVPATARLLARRCRDRYERPRIKPSESIKQGNFLFEKQLRGLDTVLLSLPGEAVRSHFPGLRNSQGGLACLTFTDAQNKQWCTQIIPMMEEEGTDTYALVSGWRSFAKVHNLRNKDVVKFYKPDQSLCWGENQFLVDYEKRNPTGTTRKNKRQRSEPHDHQVAAPAAQKAK